MDELPGKVAIVTGGSRSTGRAIARALLTAGLRVAICARDEARLAEAAEELGRLGSVLAVRADVGDEADVRRLVAATEQEFGGVDVLINNAAAGGGGRTEECDPARWDLVMATNVRGPFLLAKHVVPSMRKRGGGNIISIGSGAGKQGYAGMPAYCASKFALLGFSQSLALEVGEDNIKVAVLNPGSIASELGLSTGQPHRPSGKYLLPTDVAEAVLILLRQGPHAWTQEMNLWPFRGD
ncbi:MAG TPA: SDR family NAD(P)-dependent oxidoreductase [Chloroflexota bacterium]